MQISKNLYLLFFIIILTIAVYANALDNPFVWDDEVQILGNPLVTSGGRWNDYFISSFMTKASGATPSFYRPIVIILYRLSYVLFGSSPVGFHILSLFLHILNIVLIYCISSFIIKRYLPDTLTYRISCFISLLFAIHPVNVEAVSWISSQGDLLGLTISLISLILFLKWLENKKWTYMILEQMLLLLGLFVKESVIVVYPIFLVYCIILYRKASWRQKGRDVLRFIVSSIILVLIYLIFRIHYAEIRVSTPLSLISKASFYKRLLTLPVALVSYLKSIFAPIYLSIEHHFVIENIYDYRLIASLLILFISTVLILKLTKNVSPVFSFWFLWFFISLIPTSNIIIPLDRTISERWLYIPLYGIIAPVGAGLGYIFSRSRVFSWVLIISIIVFFGGRVIIRNNDWEDPLYLYQHDAKLSKDSFILQNNIGVELYRRGEIEKGEVAFKKSLDIEPNYSVAHNNLGAVYERRGLVFSAIEEYRRSIELSDYYLAYINLIKIYLRENNYLKAISVLEKALEIYPDDPKLNNYLRIAYQRR